MYLYAITKIKTHSVYFLGEIMNYKNKKWNMLRAKILKRDGYICQYYKRYGKRVEATVVHHIFPASEYPQWAYKEWNLIALSSKAHNIMHDRGSHKITTEGLRLQNQVIRKKKLKI